MKKILLLLVMMITFTFSFAQKTNLIFFSEAGEKFYVIMNGVLQNTKAETNVKVTDLTAPNYKLKILFADSTITPVDKNLMFQQNTETTFNIKKNNKGEYVVRYLSEVPIAQEVQPPASQTVVVYAPSGPALPVPVTTTTTVSTTQQTTTTGVGTTQPTNGVAVGINMGGVNVSMDIKDPNGTVGSSTTTTSTTTTTSSQTSMQTVPLTPQPQQYSLPGYTAAIGCPLPMSETDFASSKESISSKTFEDSKLTIAKQVIGANCMLASQVKEIMQLFTFEDNKIEIAKYAYSHTYDIGNYYKLNDAFTFESSIDELNTYVASHPK